MGAYTMIFMQNYMTVIREVRQTTHGYNRDSASNTDGDAKRAAPPPPSIPTFTLNI